jgi:DNA polymerase III gamma/tau subunit
MELHLEFRPNNFDEIIGNQETINIIKSKLQKDAEGNNNFPHAVMLHGPKGSGKTTIARIISKELGCDPDSRSGDFVELDSVQTGGIDTVREIRNNIYYAPMDQKARVYIFDEVQDSSAKFQSGLLKMLEGGAPSHVYFILCTTDPQKINAPLKSRCAKYQVKSLNEKELTELINWVLTELNENVEKDVIEQIVEVADGCPREVLVLLDSIIDLPPDKRMDAIIGSEAQKEIRDLCQGMLKNQSWSQLSKILKGIKGVEAESARRAITGYMQAVALNNPKSADRAALIFDCFRESTFTNGMPGITFACYNTTI